MDESEIRELRKQGVRLRVRDDGPPKVIQAGCDPLPGQQVVLIKDSNTADEARRVYVAYQVASKLSEGQIEKMRKPSPHDYLKARDALDRVVIEAWTEEVEELDDKGKKVKRIKVKRKEKKNG